MFFLMIRRAPRSTRTDTLFPYTTLFRSIIGAKYTPVPDGTGGVTHVIEGYQTVDFNTLGKRFKDFGVLVDTKGLQELNGLRNHIEHRFTTEPAQTVREAIARAFPITVALFKQAGEHPADVLGDAWPIKIGREHV